MGHDYVDFEGRSALFRDEQLNLVRCLMLAVAQNRNCSDTFSVSLSRHLQEFKFICNGVFSDLHLDTLLIDSKCKNAFLDFLDECAAYVCENGPVMSMTFLNELVGDSDRWDVTLNVEYPLIGLGRLANLVCGFTPVWTGYRRSWDYDELSRRMKQQRIIEHCFNNGRTSG